MAKFGRGHHISPLRQKYVGRAQQQQKQYHTTVTLADASAQRFDFAVAFEPAPAITGTLPLAASTQASTIDLCSSMERVGVSPVVPQGISP